MKPRKRPKCYLCGKCCRQQGSGLSITPEDYRRWKHQGREDILLYVWAPEGDRGPGDIWIDPQTWEELDYCPFLRKVRRGKYICTIKGTKPEICREFWCEAAYGVGRRGVTFRGLGAWSERAKQLGYAITANEAAKRLGLTESQVRRLIRQGKIKAREVIRKPDKWLIDAESLNYWRRRSPKTKEEDKNES